ncbi:NosD domain-containing protein [Vibrio salinus]|uniref:NosD domain-containing protein n=1 Tax=Vibrio salinus TaxID=2899784 RepID=UPI001E40E84B|nr:right-handed parallel beta-helix repeat-containing protein [Vibrio salinus]MCE0493289.1 right-handed parallel beta-helix repeat-containing protein [Vibrio salinus]
MIPVLIKKYLILTGIVFNLVLGYSVYSFGRILFEDQSLPTVLFHTANKFARHSVTKPVADVLNQAGKSLITPMYYWKPFDRSQWPTVGPDFKSPPVVVKSPSQQIYVSDSKQFMEALKKVEPGSTIVVADGEYILNSKRFPTSNKIPTKSLPVVVKAEHPGKASLLMNTLEGIFLNKPYWTITGFKFIGTCSNHNSCEHAVHIVGNAHDIEITNNDFVDFNAAIKVNKRAGAYPDRGKVEYNHFYYTKPRDTKFSVTPINIDHANDWLVSYNIIRDFIKIGGNKISYGAFMKGGANNGVFENNLVICNTSEKQYPGASVGLSIGGGGMPDRRGGVAYQANHTTIRNNIIFHCSDVGIYVNSGKNSVINNNTLYNTSGIDIRFPQSSALVVNNLFSGKLRSRDQGKIISNSGNIIFPRDFFTNKDALTDMFQSPETGNFSITDKSLDIKKNAVSYPVKNDEYLTDFCGKTITGKDKFIGAFINRHGCFNSSGEE